MARCKMAANTTVSSGLRALSWAPCSSSQILNAKSLTVGSWMPRASGHITSTVRSNLQASGLTSGLWVPYTGEKHFLRASYVSSPVLTQYLPGRS